MALLRIAGPRDPHTRSRNVGDKKHSAQNIRFVRSVDSVNSDPHGRSAGIGFVGTRDQRCALPGVSVLPRGRSAGADGCREVVYGGSGNERGPAGGAHLSRRSGEASREIADLARPTPPRAPVREAQTRGPRKGGAWLRRGRVEAGGVADGKPSVSSPGGAAARRVAS